MEKHDYVISEETEQSASLDNIPQNSSDEICQTYEKLESSAVGNAAVNMELDDNIQADSFSILPDISTPVCRSTVANINNAKTDENIDGTNSLASKLKQLNSCSSPECSLLNMNAVEKVIKDVIPRSNSTPSTCSSDIDVAFGRYIGSVLATISNLQKKETLKMELMRLISKEKSREMSRKYSIIKLDDRIQLIPTCWLTEDNSYCYWPNYTSSSNINSIVEKLTEPDKKSWQLHKVSRIFGTSCDYKVGLEKMKQWVTDVNTAGSDGAGSQRKRRRCQKNSSTNESQIQDQTSKQDVYILPEPPLKKKIPVLDCFSDCAEESDTLAESSANISSRRTIRYDSAPSIPVKRASVNNNPVLSLKESTKTQDKIPNKNDKDFMEAAVQNQNSISRRLKTSEDPVCPKANSKEIDPATITNVMQVFPISTDERLGNLEFFLSDYHHEKLLVSVLKTIGGSGDDQLITNILKRCISDDVAELYSWGGAKQKKAFKQLMFSSVIFQCVRHHSQTITEDKYAMIVSSWFRHAKKRREQLNPVTSNG